MGIFQQFPYSNFHELNLDQIIKIMREMQDEWEATKAEWASYKDFIDNYFATLDVSDEVLAAMRIFAADGTLNQIMDPTIATETAAWLADHITQPTTPAIDTSLTVAGAAADAKAAGDAIRNIQDNYLTYYPYALTDSQLSILGVTGVGELPRNKAYSLQGNNSTLTDMPPGLSAPFYGSLVCIKSSGWPVIIYVTSNGVPYIGTASGTTMRWYNSFEEFFKKYPYVVNDNQLGILGATNPTQLPKNRTYSFTGVTSIQDMPVDLDAPFNGIMVCIESAGWPAYIYITNTGKTYTGTSVGNTMRWDASGSISTGYETIDERLNSIYGCNITLLGDSITWGSHLTDSANGTRFIINKGGTDYYNNTSTTVWSYKLAQYLYNNYRCAVTNNSFPGCSFNDVVNNLAALIPSNSHFVFAMLGTNNWSDPSGVASMMNTLQAYCEANNITCIVLQPLITIDYVTQMSKVRGQIKQNVKEVGDTFTEYNNIIFTMHLILSNLMYDNVHPNDNAQDYILQAVKNVLHL